MEEKKGGRGRKREEKKREAISIPVSSLALSSRDNKNASRRARREAESPRVNFYDEVELTRSTAMRRYYLDGRFIGLTITR